MVNNSVQSVITKSNVTAQSLYDYVHVISAFSSMRTNGSKVLLMGMAGGSLVYEFSQYDFQIDIVDIDSRMKKIAEKYFYLTPDSYNFYEDDARHFIWKTKKKYDLIIILTLRRNIKKTSILTFQIVNNYHLQK